MLRFGKVTSETSKLRNFPVAFATWTFKELFVMKFELKLSWCLKNLLYVEEFITKKTERGGKNPATPCVTTD